jgi:hypothetical protein
MLKEHQYQADKVKDKDLNFREMYSKSIFTRKTFKSQTLSTFKEGVKLLNSNIKPVVQKSKMVLEGEKLRHQQNIKASEKRGNPKFDLITANKLLNGKFHEMDDNTELLTSSLTSSLKRHEELHQAQFLKFEA